MNGDGNGRRDWVFIYTGNDLGATVKGRYKRHWIGPESGAGAGASAAFYDLITDPRETSPKLASLIYQSGQWDRIALPFDPLEFIKFNMPDELRVTSRVDAVDQQISPIIITIK